MVRPAGGEREWRAEARRQRDAFAADSADSRPTLGNRVFRDLGDDRTWKKKMHFVAAALGGWRSGGRYLELGAGEGRKGMDPALFPVERVSVDPAPEALRANRARSRELAGENPGSAGAGGGSTADRRGPRVHYAAAYAEELPFADGCFDGAFGVDWLHHVASPARALAEVARTLRPCARLAFVEPNPRQPLNLVLAALSPVERGIYRHLLRSRLARFASEAGLADLAIGLHPVFFPSFPHSLAPAYERLERVLGQVPLVRSLSAALTIVARKP